MNIRNIKAKLVAGLLACFAIGAVEATTVSVDIPAEGGTVNTETISNSGGKWYFDGTSRPSWVSGVTLRYGGSRIMVGYGTMTFGTLKQGYFEVAAAANTGAERSWTWKILSAKGGSEVVTLVVRQAGASDADNGNDDADDDDGEDSDDDDEGVADDEGEGEEEEEEPQPITFSVSASQGTYASYVRVTWKAGTGAKSYKIYRSTVNDFDYVTFLGTTSGCAWSDYSATAGTKYWYFVRAVDADGVEHKSEAAGACGYAKKISVSIPKPTATDGKYESYVKLTWKTVSGVSKYYIYRAKTASFSGASCIGYATKGAACDKTAALGTKYYYWICPVIGSSVYVNKSTYDAGYRKVTIKVTTPKTLKVGKTGYLYLTVNGTKVTSGNFKLSYSSSLVQILSGSGSAFARVKGKKAGTAKLTVKYGDTAPAKVSWTIKVTK